jgi:hypothetical protein
MRVPGMTTRRWMSAVAVMALLLGAQRFVERRAYFLTRAEVEADRAADLIHGRACLRDEFCKEGFPEKLRDHYLALARKYRLAADRPWLPVEPDRQLPMP